MMNLNHFAFVASLCIVEELCGFQEGIRKVVDKEDKGAASDFLIDHHWSLISKVKTRSPPGEVAGPREAEEGDGGEVVDKHLPEVFSLHVEKLHDGQRPVESQLEELQV